MPAEPAKTNVDALKRAVLDLESPKAKRERERAALFVELYPAIREQLEAGVSKSAIIKTLAEHGVSLSTVMFDERLEVEAKRRCEPAPGKGSRMSTQVVLAGEAPQAPSMNDKEGL